MVRALRPLVFLLLPHAAHAGSHDDNPFSLGVSTGAVYEMGEHRALGYTLALPIRYAVASRAKLRFIPFFEHVSTEGEFHWYDASVDARLVLTAPRSIDAIGLTFGPEIYLSLNRYARPYFASELGGELLNITYTELPQGTASSVGAETLSARIFVPRVGVIVGLMFPISDHFDLATEFGYSAQFVSAHKLAGGTEASNAHLTPFGITALTGAIEACIAF